MAKRMVTIRGISYLLKNVMPITRNNQRFVALAVRPWGATNGWTTLELSEVEFQAADQRFIGSPKRKEKNATHSSSRKPEKGRAAAASRQARP